MKPCRKCGDLWNESAFRDGGHVCPNCVNARQRRYYRTHPEQRERKNARISVLYHANSTSALAHDPTRRACPVCGVIKGRRSFPQGQLICKRCEEHEYFDAR